MNEHDRYMADFMRVYETLERWGPGSDTDTLRALNALPSPPEVILEIGCGKGTATRTLLTHTRAQIVAVDHEFSAINNLRRATGRQYAHRLTPLCASMTELPFAGNDFDLIWCEAAAYIMGVSNALEQWRPLLRNGGALVLSDLVWLTTTPSKAADDFWRSEYPDMRCIDTRLDQIQQTGYELEAHFTLSQMAWKNYYEPLKRRLESLKAELFNSPVLTDIAREIAIYQQYGVEFGYQMFILRKP